MATQLENSEVSLFGSVAVAVIDWPEAAFGNVKEKLAMQLEPVVTVAVPINVFPSPNPDGSQALLAKN